ncbi:hypothetical protein AVEN_209303-1 [Araneus ventricosus]|uniref:Uncharacterized protein n=1 Tax=Araneus ventricosus TaxID=182803 RepID=A0A4Y2CAQ0_ARAVE|nr:hypothetical protein AVEN_209303-1 [Araneus ventricosus]
MKIPKETTELKRVKTVVQNVTVQKPEHQVYNTVPSSTIQYLLHKCSSWNKLLRVAAWCLRVIKNRQRANDKNKTFLIRSEFEEAQKYVQEEAFAEEI